eukprot:scaffold235183_cov30-Tisochrysis_lutea.AAC.5
MDSREYTLHNGEEHRARDPRTSIAWRRVGAEGRHEDGSHRDVQVHVTRVGLRVGRVQNLDGRLLKAESDGVHPQRVQPTALARAPGEDYAEDILEHGRRRGHSWRRLAGLVVLKASAAEGRKLRPSGAAKDDTHKYAAEHLAHQKGHPRDEHDQVSVHHCPRPHDDRGRREDQVAGGARAVLNPAHVDIGGRHDGGERGGAEDGRPEPDVPKEAQRPLLVSFSCDVEPRYEEAHVDCCEADTAKEESWSEQHREQAG